MKRNEENTRMIIARLEDLGDFGKRAIAADQIRIAADPNSENRSIKKKRIQAARSMSARKTTS